MKVGLVLEGGGLRGLYTAGVLDTFLENDIKVDCIIGVSAGALFGVNYYSKQKGRALTYNKKYAKDKRYMSIPSWILTGNYINKKFAFYKMSNKLVPFDNETYKKNCKNFFAVVTNVKTGRAEYMAIDDPLGQMEILRATSAIPLLSRMVKVGKNKYLDGGVADSIPIEAMQKLNYDKIIVVETQPINFIKEPLSKKEEKLIRIKYRNYPNLINTILTRHEAYNKQKSYIKRLERKGELFAIRPSISVKTSIKNKNPERYQEVYDLGVSDTENVIKDIKAYLKE